MSLRCSLQAEAQEYGRTAAVRHILMEATEGRWSPAKAPAPPKVIGGYLPKNEGANMHDFFWPHMGYSLLAIGVYAIKLGIVPLVPPTAVQEARFSPLLPRSL